MESLESNKDQYAVGLTAAAVQISGHFSTVKVTSALEQRRADEFVEKEFALAVVDGCHCRSCTQVLAKSGKLQTERPSQPICVTISDAAGPQSPTISHYSKPNHSQTS